MKIMFIAMSLFFCLFYSCSKDSSSEEVLKSYVKYRFSPSQSKANLLEKTTGELNFKIKNMSDEEFESFVSMEKYKMRKFEINLKRCSESQCYITYTLSYDQYTDGKRTFESEIKKIAEVQKTNGKWKLSDVSNVKTYIDSKEEIDISPMSETGKTPL